MNGPYLIRVPRVEGHRRLNVHRDEYCFFCFTIGPLGFRWYR